MCKNKIFSVFMVLSLSFSAFAHQDNSIVVEFDFAQPSDAMAEGYLQGHREGSLIEKSLVGQGNLMVLLASFLKSEVCEEIQSADKAIGFLWGYEHGLGAVKPLLKILGYVRSVDEMLPIYATEIPSMYKKGIRLKTCTPLVIMSFVSQVKWSGTSTGPTTGPTTSEGPSSLPKAYNYNYIRNPHERLAYLKHLSTLSGELARSAGGEISELEDELGITAARAENKRRAEQDKKSAERIEQQAHQNGIDAEAGDLAKLKRWTDLHRMWNLVSDSVKKDLAEEERQETMRLEEAKQAKQRAEAERRAAKQRAAKQRAAEQRAAEEEEEAEAAAAEQRAAEQRAAERRAAERRAAEEAAEPNYA